MTKNERQKLILKIIGEYDVSTQEDLVRLLNENGANVTQATTSRDLRQMRILKIMLPGRIYKYVAPKTEDATVNDKLNSMLSQCIMRVDFACNIVVVKTLPGTAQAAAAAVDSLELEEVVGTIAGDDTFMVIARDDKGAQYLSNKFKKYLPERN
jgi:transcriptional regulator of arginine metabolism